MKVDDSLEKVQNQSEVPTGEVEQKDVQKEPDSVEDNKTVQN